MFLGLGFTQVEIDNHFGGSAFLAWFVSKINNVRSLSVRYIYFLLFYYFCSCLWAMDILYIVWSLCIRWDKICNQMLPNYYRIQLLYNLPTLGREWGICTVGADHCRSLGTFNRWRCSTRSLGECAPLEWRPFFRRSPVMYRTPSEESFRRRTWPTWVTGAISMLCTAGKNLILSVTTVHWLFQFSIKDLFSADCRKKFVIVLYIVWWNVISLLGLETCGWLDTHL